MFTTVQKSRSGAQLSVMRKGAESLFTDEAGGVPLAVRMRPRNLDEVVGQERALRPGSPLRRLIESEATLSVILWGPPGTGKTTLALLLSKSGQREFVALSAADIGVKEVRDAVETARRKRALEGKRSVLFVDEIHRFNKAQQDSLLGAVENGWVSLIAATTENPSFSVINPLLSRSALVQLKSLSVEDSRKLVQAALEDPRGLDSKFTITSEACSYLAKLGGGDGRKTLTLLEAASGSAASLGSGEINLETVENVVDEHLPHYDRNAKEHYNTLSAFIKSIRGSDTDAALHYLAKMLSAGEDPRMLARRLIISASEDIGTADSNALTVAVNAAQGAALLGMPEAGYPLAHATVYLSMAPKSNAVAKALGAAYQGLESSPSSVPVHLVNVAGGAHPRYKDPHQEPDGVVMQTYLPEGLEAALYYQPKNSGFEGKFKERLLWLRSKLGK